MSFSAQAAEPVFPTSVANQSKPQAPLPLTMTDRAYLTGYAFSIVRDWQTSEALVNEAIVVAWQRQAEAPKDRTCLQWVQEMLYHRGVSVRGHVRREVDQDDSNLGFHFRETIWNVWAGTRKAKFEMELASAEKTLAALGAVERATCALYFSWHQNPEQIAAATKSTPEKAAKRIESIRKKILKPISKQFGSSMQGVELSPGERQAYAAVLSSEARQTYCVGDFLRAVPQTPDTLMRFAEFLWEWALIAAAITRLEARAPTLATPGSQQQATTANPLATGQVGAHDTGAITGTHGIALGSQDSSFVPTTSVPAQGAGTTAPPQAVRAVSPGQALRPPGQRDNGQPLPNPKGAPLAQPPSAG